MKIKTVTSVFMFLLASPSISNAKDMMIPSLPVNPNLSQTGTPIQPGVALYPESISTLPVIEKKTQNQSYSHLKTRPVLKKQHDPNPLPNGKINIKNSTTTLKAVSINKRGQKTVKPNVSRFTKAEGLPQKHAPKMKNIDYNKPSLFRQTTMKKDGLHDTDPITVLSSKGTHNLKGSGLYQNIIVMDENIKQIFSSKKISVEIRGPIAMLRFPSISGSEIDVQIITTSFRVETFVFSVDNKLQAQKFIVKKEDPVKKEKTGRKRNRGGQAIDTLISIANGKKPAGYKWAASESPRREYMGLGIREIGSYKNMNKEFLIIAITNETTATITVKEWELHNSIVLGSVKRARNVKLMSLDSYQIKSGKTTIMYVGINHPRKRDI